MTDLRFPVQAQYEDPYDPDDDLLAVIDAVPVRREPRAKPLADAGLEAVAQQVARQLGRGVRRRGSRDSQGTPGTRSGYTFWPDDTSYALQMSTGVKGSFPAMHRPDGTVATTYEDGAVKVEKPVAKHVTGSGNRGSRVKSDSDSESTKGPAAEPRGLLDVFDPRHNMREMAKEMLLLEDHLAQPSKHCPDCIRKHMLRTEAFAEEAIQLDVDGTLQDRLLPLPGKIRNLQRAFLANEAETDRSRALAGRQALQQEVRVLRKALAKESFDALAFKPKAVDPVDPDGDPGSPNRTPVIFALDRGNHAKPFSGPGKQVTDRMAGDLHATLGGVRKAQAGSLARSLFGAEAPEVVPFPATVIAALRRRLETPGDLAANPVPVLYRVRGTGKQAGKTFAKSGFVTGKKSDAELVVDTVVGSAMQSVVVPISNVALDMSGDEAFTAIPWPATLPVTRDTRGGPHVELFGISPTKDAARWLQIRVIASMLWPVVDAFALRASGGGVQDAGTGDTGVPKPKTSTRESSAQARRAILQRLLVAAVVNAVYESGLDPDVEADGGHDVGLFQLRDDGAGAGMSKTDRRDPFLNTARIAQRFLEVKKFFEPLGRAEAERPGSTSPAAWTELFCRYVEAPAAGNGKKAPWEVRGDTTAAAFVRDMPVVAVAKLPTGYIPGGRVDTFRPLPWVVGGISAAAAAIAIGVTWNAARTARAERRGAANWDRIDD